MRISNVVPIREQVESKPRYVVKRVFKDQFAVINTKTGIAQSSYRRYSEAVRVARDLNRSIK